MKKNINMLKINSIRNKDLEILTTSPPSQKLQTILLGQLKMYETKIQVRYSETDQMGVAHHSNYIIWFEVARCEMLSKTKTSYKDIENGGIYLPVISCHCNFIKKITYDETIIVSVKFDELSFASCKFSYFIWNLDKTLLKAEGSTTHAFVDKDFKIIKLKKCKKGLHDELKKMFESEEYS